MKTVISVSLGSSQGNKSSDTTYAGVPFHLERIGTDGDVRRYGDLVEQYDGKADAIGLGGVDRYLVCGSRRYEIAQVGRLARRARVTPTVDGGGVKRVLEPFFLRRLAEQGVLEADGKRVLVLAGVDRPGMAEVFPELGAEVVYGDLLFAVGVPVPIHSLRQLRLLGTLFLPLFRHAPMSMLYPTGGQQESRKPRYPEYFRRADIIAGDFHFVKRYAPPDLSGKTIVTNTTRARDVEDLRARGVTRLITTTPPVGGESFGTNVMEGALVALTGKLPEALTDQDYLSFAEQISWQPGVLNL